MVVVETPGDTEPITINRAAVGQSSNSFSIIFV